MNKNKLLSTNACQGPYWIKVITMACKDSFYVRLQSNWFKHLTGFILLVGLSSAAAQAEPKHSAQAKQQWYQVEVLVFKRDAAFEDTLEKWPHGIKRSFPKGLSTLHAPQDDSRDAFIELASEDATFTQYFNELKRRDNVSLLYHATWRQPKISRSEAHALLVQSEARAPDGQYILEGTIKIGIQRYIHIDTDLWLSDYTIKKRSSFDDWFDAFAPKKSSALTFSTPPTLPDNKPFIYEHISETQSPVYVTQHLAQMLQSRRMKRDELHYLDHPLFGLLVRTIRYEQPEIESIDSLTPNEHSNENMTYQK